VAEHVGLSVVAADNLKTLWVVTPLHPLHSGHSLPSELILGPGCNDRGGEKREARAVWLCPSWYSPNPLASQICASRRPPCASTQIAQFLPASSVNNVYESIRKTKTSLKPCCDATPRNELSDAWPLHSRSSNGHGHPFRSFRTPSRRRRRPCESPLPRPHLSQTPCGGALGSSQQRKSSNSRTLAQLPCRPARRLHRTHAPAIPAASRTRLTSDPTIDVQVGSAGGRCRHSHDHVPRIGRRDQHPFSGKPGRALIFRSACIIMAILRGLQDKTRPLLLERNHALSNGRNELRRSGKNLAKPS
jgi:hypothetical protein